MRPLRVEPRPNPFEAETCLVLGLVESVTMKGVLPFLRLTFTTPEPMSPYSTEGTPVITSTDSMLEETMLLVETPLTGLLSKSEAATKDALLDRRTPSTSTAVPKEADPFSPEPARMLNCFSEVSDGSTVAPPGRRLEMSETFISWTWSRAMRSMVRVVVAELPSSCAVTMALSSERLSGLSSTRKSMSLLNFMSRAQVT